MVTAILGSVILSFMLQYLSFGFEVITVGMIYVFLIIFSTIKKNQYDKERNFTISCANNIVYLSSQMSLYTRALFRTSKVLSSENVSNKLPEIRQICGFQAIAFSICKRIFELIETQYNNDSQYITVFQRFHENNHDICKMVAFANKGDDEPATYQNSYQLLVPKKNKTDMFIQIFCSGENGLIILPCKEDVSEKFLIHKKSSIREKNICQYIGIPLVQSSGDVVLLLQIDIDKPCFFGTTVEEIRMNIEVLFLPYARFLHMAYEQDRMIQIALSSS